MDLGCLAEPPAPEPQLWALRGSEVCVLCSLLQTGTMEDKGWSPLVVEARFPACTPQTTYAVGLTPLRLCAGPLCPGALHCCVKPSCLSRCSSRAHFWETFSLVLFQPGLSHSLATDSRQLPPKRNPSYPQTKERAKTREHLWELSLHSSATPLHNSRGTASIVFYKNGTLCKMQLHDSSCGA